MSEQVKIGRLITGDAARDAIHVAIAPVTAGEFDLRPGTLIGFDEPGCEVVRARADGIGIVDPFLEAAPNKGERFYMFLLPNTITSLRHQWTHPAFPMAEPSNQQAKAEAIAWLSSFAANNYLDYDELICAAERYVKYDDYLCEGGRFAGCYVPDEFWNYYERATGQVVPNSARGSFFSCSC